MPMTDAERLEFTRDWYATRIERLADLCKKHGCWDDASKILANGTTGIDDPPTYARTLNTLRARIAAAEAALDAAQAKLDAAQAKLDAAQAKLDAAPCLTLACAHCGPESAGPASDNSRTCATCCGVLILTDDAGAAELRRRYDEDAAEASVAAAHPESLRDAAQAERLLGDHDARNQLWLAGDSIKHANITSPAGKAAYDRFEAIPRVEVEGGFPRNTPKRIDALVSVIDECHEIWSEWHDGPLTREEAEAYVRRHGARR